MSIRACVRALALCLPLLTTVPATAQGPERVRRFAAAAPGPAQAVAVLRDEVTFAGIFWGSVVGWGSAVVVLYGIASTGACWEGCPAWVDAAVLLPFAVLPALGAHAGSRRTGNVWVTLAVSSATMGLGAWLARDGVDGNGWIPFTVLHLSVTTLAELATSPAGTGR